MKDQPDHKQLLSRVITFLTREELDFIDKISKDSLFSTGIKLPRTKIIEAMVEVCMKAGINGEEVRSKEELMNRIFEAISREAVREQKKDLSSGGGDL